jgi:protein PhnA
MYVCPECAHEWSKEAVSESVEQERVVRDAFGNILHDGDSVTMIKDLKVKGASSTLKVGTKVKNIRLVEGDHNIDCKIDGFGAMKLKSEFVKKA